jgi:hypothetical protein
MDDKSKAIECTQKCDEQFKNCMLRGENESACKMKRVQCDSSCVVY